MILINLQTAVRPCDLLHVASLLDVSLSWAGRALEQIDYREQHCCGGLHALFFQLECKG